MNETIAIPLAIDDNEIKKFENDVKYKITTIIDNKIDDYEKEIKNKIDEKIIILENVLSNYNLNPENILFETFSTIFEFVKLPKYTTDEEKPLYSATQSNIPTSYTKNGIIKTNEILLSIVSTGDGACGYVHIMEPGEFALQSRHLFKPLVDCLNLEFTAILMTEYLHNIKKYSRNKGITKENFINEQIPIYVNTI